MSYFQKVIHLLESYLQQNTISSFKEWIFANLNWIIPSIISILSFIFININTNKQIKNQNNFLFKPLLSLVPYESIDDDEKKWSVDLSEKKVSEKVALLYELYNCGNGNAVDIQFISKKRKGKVVFESKALTRSNLFILKDKSEKINFIFENTKKQKGEIEDILLINYSGMNNLNYTILVEFAYDELGEIYADVYSQLSNKFNNKLSQHNIKYLKNKKIGKLKFKDAISIEYKEE